MIHFPKSPLPIAGALTAAIALSACASVPPPASETIATAMLVDAKGSPTGEASLLAIGDRVELSVTAEGLSPGEHGFHLHTTGR